MSKGEVATSQGHRYNVSFLSDPSCDQDSAYLADHDLHTGWHHGSSLEFVSLEEPVWEPFWWGLEVQHWGQT